MNKLEDNNMQQITGGTEETEPSLHICPTCKEKSLKVLSGTNYICTNSNCPDHGVLKSEL